MTLSDKHYWTAILVLVAGVLLSVTAFWVVKAELANHRQMEFEWVAHDRNRALKKGIEEGLDAVRSVRDLFRASEQVSEREFQLFARALFSRYRGIHALEWVQVVTSKARTAHEQGLRSVNASYQILEPSEEKGGLQRAGNRDLYFPVRYVESEQRRSHPIGLDHGFDPLRRDLMERARDSGSMVVSGRIELVLGNTAQYGFMAFQPVYANDEPIETTAQRRRALQGFVVGVYRIADLADAATRLLEPRGVEFLLRDESAPAGKKFLDFYDSRLNRRPGSTPEYTVRPNWDLPDARKVTETFPVADRLWSITCSPTRQFRSGEGFAEGPWVILGGGLVLTLIMVLFILHTRREMRVRMGIEQELRESEQKLRILFHQSPDIIMTVDRDGCVLIANRPMPGGRIAGAGQCSIDFLPKRARARFHQALERVFQTGDTDELRYAGDDSDWWELRVVPLREGSRVTAAMVIATNVTEKRVLEAQAIGNARLASLGVLAASVAHEINNPNNAIQFNASILSRSWGDIVKVLEQHRREYGEFTVGGVPVGKALEGLPRLLEGIVKSSRRIQGIVGNLKHMARPDQGELDHRVDPSEVLRTTLSILQNQIQKHTDHCRLEVDDSLPAVRGNEQQLEQVFINLVLNALQALPNRRAEVVITAAPEAEGEFVRVCVSDQGHGIPDDIKARVTDPFFTTKGTAGGTGLGLSICLRIVQNHSGRMEILSSPGAGTKVIVWLPVADK